MRNDRNIILTLSFWKKLPDEHTDRYISLELSVDDFYVRFIFTKLLKNNVIVNRYFKNVSIRLGFVYLIYFFVFASLHLLQIKTF